MVSGVIVEAEPARLDPSKLLSFPGAIDIDNDIFIPQKTDKFMADLDAALDSRYLLQAVTRVLPRYCSVPGHPSSAPVSLLYGQRWHVVRGGGRSVGNGNDVHHQARPLHPAGQRRQRGQNVPSGRHAQPGRRVHSLATSPITTGWNQTRRHFEILAK